MFKKIVLLTSCFYLCVCSQKDNEISVNKKLFLSDEIGQDLTKFSEFYRSASRIQYLNTQLGKEAFQQQLGNDCKNYKPLYFEKITENLEINPKLENEHYNWDNTDKINANLNKIIDEIAFTNLNMDKSQLEFIQNIKVKIKNSSNNYIKSLDESKDNLFNPLDIGDLVKKQIAIIENEIIENNNISIENKKIMFISTTSLLMNIENIITHTENMLNQGLINTKVLNWFTRALKFTVIAITVAVIFTVAIVGGAWAGAALTGGSAIGIGAGIIAGGYIAAIWGTKFVKWIDESWEVE